MGFLHRAVHGVTAADGRLAAFVAGVLLVSLAPALPPGPMFVPTFLLAILLVLLLPLLLPLTLALRRRALVLLPLALGLCWACLHGEGLLASRLPVACDGRWSGVSGVIEGLPQRRLMAGGSWQQRVQLRVEAIVDPACAGPRRLSLAYYGEQRLQPGERWRFVARLRLPWGEANPESSNRQDYYARAGIDAVASVRAGTAERLAGAEGRAPFARARAALLAALGETLGDSPATGFLGALLVGERAGLADRDWALLRALGVVHLVVISGLHVSLVAGGGFLLGGLAARCAAVLGWGAAWALLRPGAALVAASAYAALAGFTLPTQRALAMLGCVCAALLLGRPARSSRHLLLAAVLALAGNPLAAVGSSFWLSFLAVAWLLWFAGRCRGQARWRTALSVHGFMALAMAPLTAWWFGGASLASAPANLLLVPFVGLVLVPLVLGGALCWPWLAPGAEACWSLAAALLEPLLAAGRALSGAVVDGLYLETGSSGLATLCAVVGTLLLFGARRRSLRLAGAVAILPLLLPGPGGWAATPALTVLDVGQGTAVVYRSGERTLVYDTGGGDPDGANAARRVLLPFLRRAGVRRIDMLVVSHPDRDHSAGVATLLEAMPVGELRYGAPLPGIEHGERCRAGASWRWPDGSVFRLLSAAPGELLDRNDASCVLRIDVRGQRFLLTGDIARDRERQLVRYWRKALRANWLLVAHHGSASSTSAAFLRTVAPRRAALTFGRANPFGHPAPAVLHRLCRRGVQLDGTAAGGALHYQVRQDGTVAVERYRERARRYWRRAPPLTPLDCHEYNQGQPEA